MKRWVIVTCLGRYDAGLHATSSCRCFSFVNHYLNYGLLDVLDSLHLRPGSRGSPEQGMANFTPVAPGLSAAFYSEPAIAWGFIHQTYYSVFGAGGAFTIDAPGGMQLSGMLTSGVAFRFPSGYAATVA